MTGKAKNVSTVAAPVPIETQLGASAASILKLADRVEVFRIGKPSGKSLKTTDTCSVMSMGKDQGPKFAKRLSSLLLSDSSYDSYEDLCVIDPAVIFRLWHGNEHVDAIICFKCSELQIATDLPSGEQQYLMDANFIPVRGDLLRLAKQALPKDPIIKAIK